MLLSWVSTAIFTRSNRFGITTQCGGIYWDFSDGKNTADYKRLQITGCFGTEWEHFQNLAHTKEKVFKGPRIENKAFCSMINDIYRVKPCFNFWITILVFEPFRLLGSEWQFQMHSQKLNLQVEQSSSRNYRQLHFKAIRFGRALWQLLYTS